MDLTSFMCTGKVWFSYVGKIDFVKLRAMTHLYFGLMKLTKIFKFTNILRCQFPFAKKIQTQTVSTLQLRKTLLYKKAPPKNDGDIET